MEACRRMRLALTIEYEGTRYRGFQYQVDAPSIQGELELAIVRLTGERARVRGAGRTDAGVHAEAQVATFDTASKHPTATVVSALNHYLPPDIAVKAAHVVRPDFDARRDARRRIYRYTILNGATPSPLARRFACHIRHRLDVERMREAASVFVGEHDFRRFAAPLQDGKTNSVRAIHSAVVSGGSWRSAVGGGSSMPYTSGARMDETLVFEVAGNAFLQRQVRRMAGALVDIGRGRLSTNDLQAMLDGGQTDKVAHSLPAHGLCLVGVEYADYPPRMARTGSDG